MLTNTRPTAAIAMSLLGAALALAAWPVLARDGDQPAPSQPGPSPARYEYARLVIDDGLAVLVTDDAIQKIEIPLQPPPDSTVFRNGLGAMQRRFDPLLFSLNAFGAQGWELITEKVPCEGDEVLVRRAR